MMYRYENLAGSTAVGTFLTMQEDTAVYKCENLTLVGFIEIHDERQRRFFLYDRQRSVQARIRKAQAAGEDTEALEQELTLILQLLKEIATS